MTVTDLSKTLYGKDGRVRGSFVYMLLCQDSGPIYVKIGLSNDPFQRMHALRNGCPVELRRFAFVAVPSRKFATKLEMWLHHDLSPWRSQGEWFKFAPEEKPDFNKGWQAAFSKCALPGWPLTWTQMPVAKLMEQWERRKRFAQRLWRRRGRSYQDYLRHCKS